MIIKCIYQLLKHWMNLVICFKSFIKSPYLVSALTEQFKTYLADESLKNQVWTPYYVCDLMYGLMKQYTSSEFNLLDPCIGGNNLIKPFISNSNLKHVYGCEYEKIMYQYSSIDLILNKIDSTIYYEDLMLNIVHLMVYLI